MECADRERFNNYFRFELQAWGVELMLRGRVQKCAADSCPVCKPKDKKHFREREKEELKPWRVSLTRQ